MSKATNIDEPKAGEELDERPRRTASSRRASKTSAYRAKIQEALGMPRPGHVVAEKYRIDDMLGMGGMGAVFGATNIVTGKRVALKWLLPGVDEVEGAEERLLREAKATARIDHPNVVNVFDVGRHASGLFLVMELLRGESLSERLMRGPLPPGEAIALLLPALHGVAAAHAHGIVHRDLKPDNIFVCYDQDGTFRDSKVLDFGISKFTTESDMSLTATGALLGTPCYMAPEQVRGAKHIDQRADIYALGVILYELFTDAYPFDADSFGSLMFKIVMDEPTPLRELDSGLGAGVIAVVERAMAKDPAARFTDVESLIEAVSPFADSELLGRMSQLPEGLRPVRVSTPRVTDAEAFARATTHASTPPPGPDRISGSVRRPTPTDLSGRTLVGRPDSQPGVESAAVISHPGRPASTDRRWMVLAALAAVAVVAYFVVTSQSASPDAEAPNRTLAAPASLPSPAKVEGLPGGALAPAQRTVEMGEAPVEEAKPLQQDQDGQDRGPEAAPAPAVKAASPPREDVARAERRRVRRARLRAERKAKEDPAEQLQPVEEPTTPPSVAPAASAPQVLPADWDSRVQPVEMKPSAPLNPAGDLSADDL